MSTGTGTTVKTRKNALAMGTWDDPLLYYAKAVGEMKKRPMKDPSSWKFQAAIHGFTLDPRYVHASTLWKQWTKGETLPSTKDQNTYWAQCQHGSWYFLPGIALYLGYFEQIVRQIVVALKGPADWALPYWNYTAGPASGKLPDAFFQTKLPDGSANPLFEPARNRGNNGQTFLPPSDVSVKAAFRDHQFAGGAQGASPGFGGPVTIFSHGGGTHGDLESLPHDQVHVDVGGLMGDPGTAGFDPIFYLHHANIDRLWEIWLKDNKANKNPTVAAWLTKLPFNFRDGAGTAHALKPGDVLDTTKAPFYYHYDDLTTPASAAGAKPQAVGAQPLAAEAVVVPMSEQPIPEMIGASSAATPLTNEAKTLEVRLFPMVHAEALLGAADAHFEKAFLHLENVRGKGQPESYDVYLNVPAGAGQPPEKLHVGTMATFGLEHASIATERHPGNGLRFTFDITDTVNLLKSENHWDPALVRVTFVPRDRLPEGAALEVGRVSMYYTRAS